MAVIAMPLSNTDCGFVVLLCGTMIMVIGIMVCKRRKRRMKPTSIEEVQDLTIFSSFKND